MSQREAQSSRVLFLAPEPYYRLRGICIAQQACLETLVLLGNRVDLLTFPFGTDEVPPGVSLFRIPRVPFVRDIPIGPSLPKLLHDAVLLPAVFLMLCRNRYETVHACEESAFLAALLKPIFGFKLVYDMDDVLSLRVARSGFIRSRIVLGLISRLERWMMRASDVILTNSRETTEFATVAAGHARVVFYDHAPPVAGDREKGEISSEESARLREYCSLNGEKLILYSGNLEPYQGVELLIDALPEVFAGCAEAKCVVIGGEAEQVRALEARVRALGISDSVQLLGKKPLDWSLRFMRAADVLVSPMTQTKAVPMKLYAYLSAGVPIVATDLPNHTELLDEESAVLVEPRAADLAGGILKVLASRELSDRMSENIRKRYAQLPGDDSVLRLTQEAYRRLNRFDGL